MRRFWLALLVLVVGAVGGVSPVWAQDDPPELAALNTVRENELLLFNNQPLQVCQRTWQGWNRVHGVCRDLVTATVYDQRLIAGTSVEFVLFDGKRYERVNNATSWAVSDDASFAPDLPLGDALFSIEGPVEITQVGPADVAGTAAMQYQFWVADDERNTAAGGQIVYDQFFSNAGYVLKQHLAVRGTIPGLGDGALVEIRSFSDFNAPLTVSAPL